jgi:hypothetical protein
MGATEGLILLASSDSAVTVNLASPVVTNISRRDVACNVSAGSIGAAGKTQQAASLRHDFFYFPIH